MGTETRPAPPSQALYTLDLALAELATHAELEAAHARQLADRGDRRYYWLSRAQAFTRAKALVEVAAREGRR